MKYDISAYLQENRVFAIQAGYRPSEYPKQKYSFDEAEVTFCLCSIAPPGNFQFSFGADIIFKVLAGYDRVFVDKAVILPENFFLKHINTNVGYLSMREVKDFDIVGISAYMIFQHFNVVPFLARAGIDPVAVRRKKPFPLVILGGQNSFVSESVADFFDIIFIGEGEEGIIEIVDIVAEHKIKYGNNYKDRLLKKLSTIQGVYVPCYYKPNRDGKPEPISDEFPRVIHKRFIKKENLGKSILRADDFCSKYIRKVIELARGCKYNCYFCRLNKVMYPFRINKKEDVLEAVKTYVGRTKCNTIYPFAPDESSYPYHQEIRDFCLSKGLKYYHYNFRLDTIKESDCIHSNPCDNRIVFGIDGISRRMIEYCNKQINIDRLFEVAVPIFANAYDVLKLNYVFAYEIEEKEDYEEFYEILRRLLTIRDEIQMKGLKVDPSLSLREEVKRLKKAGVHNTMVHIAPTPFIPEAHTPLQWAKAVYNEDYKRYFLDVINRIRQEFIFFKCEGLNSVPTHNLEVILNRVGREFGKIIYYLWKKSIYQGACINKKACSYIFRLIPKLYGFPHTKFLGRLDMDREYPWYHIDWSGGLIEDYIGYNRAIYKEVCRKWNI